MKPHTYDKALELNLDPKVYGTFAEIGAGQETANWFFRASGSAGLLAKSISAYDMTMSDAIYGKANRYVSEDRLKAMLSHEYAILLERLEPKRGADTTFFSFCNTVRARGYMDQGECHGWLGIRFQMKPGAPPSDIILHVRMLDQTNADQMEALGVVGVNLIHSAFRLRTHLAAFVDSLVDDLTPGRVEVDLLKFSGHGFDYVDNRLCALQLVQSRLTEAAMFLPTGEVVQPAEALYRKPVLLLRGSFTPVMRLHLEMLRNARKEFVKDLDAADAEQAVELCEIAMNNPLRDAEIDPLGFIDRADALQALGKTVLVSGCSEFHRIASFLTRCTSKSVGLMLSIGLLNELFKPKWSADLAGGVLESFGRLFKNNVTLWVFPWKHGDKHEKVSVENFRPPAGSVYLYQHFVANQRIRGVECPDDEWLRYTGRDVIQMIRDGEPAWKDHVPEAAWRMAERFANPQDA